MPLFKEFLFESFLKEFLCDAFLGCPFLRMGQVGTITAAPDPVTQVFKTTKHKCKDQFSHLDFWFAFEL